MPPDKDQLPVEWVDENHIREQFNDEQFLERVRSGDLTEQIKRNSHLDKPPAGEPDCTHSQIVYYYDQDSNPVAVIHQYLRPDGQLGASGLPDPKRLIYENRIVSVKTTPPREEN